MGEWSPGDQAGRRRGCPSSWAAPCRGEGCGPGSRGVSKNTSRGTLRNGLAFLLSSPRRGAEELVNDARAGAGPHSAGRGSRAPQCEVAAPRGAGRSGLEGYIVPLPQLGHSGQNTGLLKPPFPHEKDKDDDTGDFPRFLPPPTPFLKDTRRLLAWSARIGRDLGRRASPEPARQQGP